MLKEGKDVVGKLLVDLQVRKSTADATGAREYYTTLTNPIEGWEGEIRDLVLKKKQVRFGFTCGVSSVRLLTILYSRESSLYNRTRSSLMTRLS